MSFNCLLYFLDFWFLYNVFECFFLHDLFDYIWSGTPPLGTMGAIPNDQAPVESNAKNAPKEKKPFDSPTTKMGPVLRARNTATQLVERRLKEFSLRGKAPLQVIPAKLIPSVAGMSQNVFDVWWRRPGTKSP